MELAKKFEALQNKRVLVIGDIMADAYIRGKVDRISPEAPVPIIQNRSKELRLGGAANVALNLRSLGAQVSICALVGTDDAGSEIRKLLKKEQIDDSGLVVSTARPTTVKTRVIANGQHLLRIDEEDDALTQPQEKQALLDVALSLLATADAVIFEDYDKGVVFQELIERITEAAEKKGIPVTVDPKKRNFLDYKGATLFKPNVKELREGLKLDVDPHRLSEVENACRQVVEKIGAKGVLFTLSEHGMAIWLNNTFIHTPALPRDIADVSGAGDTVIAVATASLMLNLPSDVVLKLSNLAGGLVCEYSGVVPISLPQLLKEAVKEIPTV